ncbi:MAG: iron-containing alcohol dehydrogenase [Salibacteraceae bacterium]
MLNFEFQNPVKVLFGKGQIDNIKEEIPAESKVLVLYGGGSIKKNGIYDQVMEALKDFTVFEYGGIPANPEYEVLMGALELIKKENVDFLLAVGGGSVIDGTKFLSGAANFEGKDPWAILEQGIPTLNGMPFGTVLTLPATGSEMNSGAVITKASTQQKRVMGGKGLFPKFSILDPSVVASIPERQLQNGVIDAYVHVLEQYLTTTHSGKLQDRIAEGILSTLVEIGPEIVKNPSNYELASNFMWSCTMALNGLIQKGVPTDWATHMIGHELTALHGIDHARTLAIIGPSLMRHQFISKKDKLAQYGQRVWGLEGGTTQELAEKALVMTEQFYWKMGMKTKLSENASDFDRTSQTIFDRFTKRGWNELGENKIIGPQQVKEIVELAI